MSTLIADYKFTQQTLYSIAETMYDSLSNPITLALFAAVKPGKYVPGIIADLQGRRQTAFDLPDSVQRDADHETDKIDLMKLRDNCDGNFQILKGYIHDGFDKSLWKTKYDEAGMVNYTAAEHSNWVSVVGMNKKMNDFIAKYPDELSAGYMPLTFAGQVTVDGNKFDKRYNAFKSAKQTGTGTGDKLTADNIVYADLQGLQNDAHIVFRNNPEMLKLFVIEEVRKVVSPLGSASFKLELIEVGTNLPIGNADVVIQSATGVAIKGVTDVAGVVEFKNVDPDNYKVLIQINGKPDINETKEVNTGVNARMKVMVG